MIKLFLSALVIGFIKGFMKYLGARINNARASISGTQPSAGMWG